MNLFKTNQDTYEQKRVVKYYINDTLLQSAEKKIITKLQDSLKDFSMLDLGIGGGRTTGHFEPLVKKYIGTDYSKNMIESCKKKFPGLDLRVLDAREMSIFKDNTFDLILFSFNGIDYMNKDDRKKTLKEIKRICKTNGVFIFSTHNINVIPKIFSLKISLNPLKLAARILKLIKLYIYNESPFKCKEKEIIINDGAHNFCLKTFYINPEEQIIQLKDFGFSNITLYDNLGNENLQVKGSWVYYMCKKI